MSEKRFLIGSARTDDDVDQARALGEEESIFSDLQQVDRFHAP